MIKVGNQTNSQDPQAVNSRIFVGNLNTYVCSKADIEKIFQRYGKIVGISMHRGYAFIQYTTPAEARSACIGEDVRELFGQPLDVNMVTEPKPHQGRKRSHAAMKNGNHDWDFYYDSYYSHSPVPVMALPPTMRSTPPYKRPRMVKTLPITQDRSSDILICGNCRLLFRDLAELSEHKQNGSCASPAGTSCPNCKTNEYRARWPVPLCCATCKEEFANPWELVQHGQSSHQLLIYEETLTSHRSNSFTENQSNSERDARQCSPCKSETDSSQGTENCTLLHEDDDNNRLHLSPHSQSNSEDCHLRPGTPNADVSTAAASTASKEDFPAQREPHNANIISISPVIHHSNNDYCFSATTSPTCTSGSDSCPAHENHPSPQST